MYCPTCEREVAPMRKTDWAAAFTTMGAGTVTLLIISGIFTLGLAPMAYVGLVLIRGLSDGSYKYCPVCYTPLTAPRTLFDISSDQVQVPTTGKTETREPNVKG